MVQQAFIQAQKQAQGSTPAASGLLQRKCDACRKKKPALQRAAAGPSPQTVPTVVHDALRTSGMPLDAATRAFFEPRFGYDLSRVRVHADARAGDAAGAVRARAFAAGQDLFFAPGKYSPHTDSGKRLLAHELAHVIQGSPAIAREAEPVPVPGFETRGSSWERAAGYQPRLRPHVPYVPRSISPKLELSQPGDEHEREADLVAERVLRMEKPGLQSGEAVNHRRVSASDPRILQRDLALELPEEAPEQPELTDAQVQAAIRYNRASYSEDSIRLIQDLVGAEQTGTFDESTVRLVARIQRDFGLVPADGKVGPNTYDLLIRELQAEGTVPGTCLTLFQIVGPEPLTFFRNSPTHGTIGSRFFMRARFDPRCNCEDFEYRQYIAGNVELHDVAGPVFNLNSRFVVPGGLQSTLTEDGDSTIPAGDALHNYGHRRYRGNPNCDRYLPDRRTGCEYEGCDFPELTPIPAAAGDAGDRYDWTMRFRGVINRKGHGMVEEKYWAIRGSIVLPPP